MVVFFERFAFVSDGLDGRAGHLTCTYLPYSIRQESDDIFQGDLIASYVHNEHVLNNKV